MEIREFNNSKEWYFEGQRHRTDGPAIEYANGDKEWFYEGKRHRIDGPAIEYVNCYKEWFYEDKRHRTDGPAVEYANGDLEWWINNCKISEKEDKSLSNTRDEICYDDNYCPICYQNKIIITLNCGHSYCCSCSLHIAKCAICRSEIKSRKKISD